MYVWPCRGAFQKNLYSDDLPTSQYFRQVTNAPPNYRQSRYARRRRKSYLCGIRSCMTALQKQIWRNAVFHTCRARIPPLLPCRVHAWHCLGAPSTHLDPLRAVGAVQVGAAVRAEVVAGLYVDHRVSAHGALFFLACGHLPCSRIRFILLMLAGTAPAAAAIRPIHAPALGSPPVCLDRRRALSP